MNTTFHVVYKKKNKIENQKWEKRKTMNWIRTWSYYYLFSFSVHKYNQLYVRVCVCMQCAQWPMTITHESITHHLNGLSLNWRYFFSILCLCVWIFVVVFICVLLLFVFCFPFCFIKYAICARHTYTILRLTSYQSKAYQLIQDCMTISIQFQLWVLSNI